MNKSERIILILIVLLIIIFSIVTAINVYAAIKLHRENAAAVTRLNEIEAQISSLDNILQSLQTQDNTQLRELQKQSDSIKKLQEAVKLPSYLMRRTGLSLDWANTIISESNSRGIPLDMWLGQIDYESEFNPEEKNPKSSATGLGQFLHSTGKWVAGELGVPFSPEMLNDPVYNTKLAGWYLEYLYKQTGSWEKAFFMYGDQTSSYMPRVISRGSIYRKELAKLKVK